MVHKTRKLYSPTKYYKGLSERAKVQRAKEIQKYGSMSWKDPRAYVGFRTNRTVRTKESPYTVSWKRKFPEAVSLKEKSEVTGVPLPYINSVFRRGMAAWRTGHRPGATQQQWGYARVHSFLLCGKTYYTADSDIVREAVQTSKSSAQWWSKLKCR